MYSPNIPYPTDNNSINATLSDIDDDDKTIVTSSNCATHLQHANHICLHHDDYGMLDSGTTGNFISMTANVKNIRPTTNPLRIVASNGQVSESTHECQIDWPLSADAI